MNRQTLMAFVAGIASVLAVIGILVTSNTDAEAQSGLMAAASGAAVRTPTGVVADPHI